MTELELQLIDLLIKLDADLSASQKRIAEIDARVDTIEFKSLDKFGM